MIHLHVDYATPVAYLDDHSCQTWANAALNYATEAEASGESKAELCLRIIDEAEMTELNGKFRQKYTSTNVLSFPADLPPGIEDNFIGDIAICAPVVEREAEEQSKDLQAHWAHMVVHGCLHLLGMDHMSDREADDMESTEVQILAGLGFTNPYLSNQSSTELSENHTTKLTNEQSN